MTARRTLSHGGNNQGGARSDARIGQRLHRLQRLVAALHLEHHLVSLDALQQCELGNDGILQVIHTCAAEDVHALAACAAGQPDGKVDGATGHLRESEGVEKAQQRGGMYGDTVKA